jgi:hypothetical protein
VLRRCPGFFFFGSGSKHSSAAAVIIAFPGATNDRVTLVTDFEDVTQENLTV